jgi:hypothetical protein
VANALLDLADLSLLRHRPREALDLAMKAQNMLKGLEVRIPIWDAALESALVRALVQARGATRRTNNLAVRACSTFERLHSLRRKRELLRWFNDLPVRAGKPPATSCADLPRGPVAAQLPHQ